ncbi:type IV secretory system conjugative DNA transfer family protein [Maritimibacter fusiformis]|uniref:Type IV secretory system conjugative DNA transfer family protein n=1 Tax=Maritimibacter fusiformis TaxID=2603819 RepID=A0A5D0RSG2_9RHOB|nr:type IV secretory system conjugative DNA transfer family protein [Maritimibacter fusiformis]TYB83481.1 type IV secretory system conjugative DNA transfer family protein [Maritimibacter fusiformis]
MNPHESPYGSARFADDLEVLRAFRDRGGVPFGFYNRRKLFHAKQAGMLLIGGAGSGKFTTVLAHVMDAPGRKTEPPRYAFFDPKRELRTVLEPYFAHIKAAVFEINTHGTLGFYGNRVSLFPHLTPDSLRLVGDSRRAARTFIAESGGGDARFFEQKAQNWLDPLIRGLVHLDGGVSPSSLYELVGMIRSAPEAWAEISTLMADLGEPDLRVTFAEMHTMAEDASRTYESIMAEIANAVAFMNDPRLQDTFVSTAQADFSLEVLCEASDRPVFVFFTTPPEMTQQNAALIRQFFSTLRTLKQAKPNAPTLNLVIDEAAQLGAFPEIAEFYSIGRGFGLCPVCVYQDFGQIRKNLGPTGAMTLSASADLEMYLGGGISDLETARMLSAKLGNQTLELEDHLVQERAQRSRREALYEAFFGKGNPMRTGAALRALDYEQQHKRKISRPLRTPEEILGMPQSQALVSASGYGIPPFFAEKTPYYQNATYTGLYGPNPYFDRDLSTVNVPGRIGRRKTLRVIREAVPASHAHLPQYQSGEWHFIEGHRPKP